MAMSDLEFLARLKATFRGEAEEHIRTITDCLIELEKAKLPERRDELMETVFREAHSFKGAARSVSLKEIESVCQALEGAFSALKGGSIAASPELFDLLHRSVDAIARILASFDMEGSAAERAEARRRGRELGKAASGLSPIPEPPKEEAEDRPRPLGAPDEKLAAASTVRIPTERLDSLLTQAEEMVAITLSADERSAEMREIDRAFSEWRKESGAWKDGARNQRNETQLEELGKKVAASKRALEQDQRSIRRMVDEHLEGMKKAVMLPLSTLVESFPRIVRDLARDQGKEAQLIVRGAEIESDKRILEELKDPFIHLLRNCVDHGIRSPEERVARGKPPAGIITIAFTAIDGLSAEILVSDDGAGVDTVLVRAAAVKAGILSSEAAESLGEEEAQNLIFHSGISTSPIITDISGRGLGLAIVREKAERLGGFVSVASRSHRGTTFRIVFPLSLATFRGIVARVGDRVFILPTTGVERVSRLRVSDIKTIASREMIRIAGRNLSLVSLAEVLGLPDRSPRAPDDSLLVAILAVGETRVAFVVDEVLDEMQVMLKGLGSQISQLRNVAGAAILGNGKVVPVLKVSDLVRSALRTQAAPRSAARSEAEGEASKASSKKAHILVAEDSITARSLLKNILESAGYAVTTAVDGAAAFAQAREGEFDLVVSDVDMPRLSGFELTQRIRADKRLSATPVVLVTALESREDRERGIDAGADAYIVKSSFDQSNLLDVLRRLL